RSTPPRLLAGLVGLALLAAPGGPRAEELRHVRGVVHVHTDFTTGELALDEIVERARRQGIEAIFLSENYLVRVAYGLYPFRALFSLRQEQPSVLGRGPERGRGAAGAAAPARPPPSPAPAGPPPALRSGRRRGGAPALGEWRPALPGRDRNARARTAVHDRRLLTLRGARDGALSGADRPGRAAGRGRRVVVPGRVRLR